MNLFYNDIKYLVSSGYSTELKTTSIPKIDQPDRYENFISFFGEFSSAGSVASVLHTEGHRFESYNPH